MIGQSLAIQELLNLIQKVAQTKTNILIIGESGTGKELVARMIHEGSGLKNKPFIAVNCGAIPETLIESELFGHKRGSFTGAVAEKPGLFEVATGGSLFLDEVGEIPLSMQVKLLRALQDRTIRRVGGNDSIKVDARIIAATNRNLEEAVKKGTFREDLYYRLNVIQIKTPPLRSRAGDIHMLAEHFLDKFNKRTGKNLKGFDKDALVMLESYYWPGNVRELENVIERAITLEPGPKITADSLPINVQDLKPQAEPIGPAVHEANSTQIKTLSLPAPDFTKGTIKLDLILDGVEKIYLDAAIETAQGNKTRAAELLGITFRSIRYRLKKFGADEE